mgnify:CR=1 FL=1
MWRLASILRAAAPPLVDPEYFVAVALHAKFSAALAEYDTTLEEDDALLALSMVRPRASLSLCSFFVCFFSLFAQRWRSSLLLEEVASLASPPSPFESRPCSALTVRPTPHTPGPNSLLFFFQSEATRVGLDTTRRHCVAIRREEKALLRWVRDAARESIAVRETLGATRRPLVSLLGPAAAPLAFEQLHLLGRVAKVRWCVGLPLLESSVAKVRFSERSILARTHSFTLARRVLYTVTFHTNRAHNLTRSP